jgi:hypothetical protein
MGHIHRSIESAKVAGSAVKSAIDGSPLNGAPLYLMQLAPPRKPAEADALRQVTLPGAIEDDPDDGADPQAAKGTDLSPRSGGGGHGASGSDHSPAREETTTPAHLASQEEMPPPLTTSEGVGAAEEGFGEDESEEGREERVDSDPDSDEDSDGWPPKPPLMRFKMREIFGNRFKTSEEMDALRIANEEQRKKHEFTKADLKVAAVGEMKDMIIGWLNHFFEFTIINQVEMEAGFPLVVLFMLDAVYPNRIPWGMVDWKLQYKRAMKKNFSVLDKFWHQVNMDKAKEFRVENTSLRLENMPKAVLREKLGFLKLIKRWFDIRIHHAPKFEPIKRRHEIKEMCRVRGHTIHYPSWVVYDSDMIRPTLAKSETEDFAEMPEYQRLRLFLGSAAHQNM